MDMSRGAFVLGIAILGLGCGVGEGIGPGGVSTVALLSPIEAEVVCGTPLSVVVSVENFELTDRYEADADAAPDGNRKSVV